MLPGTVLQRQRTNSAGRANSAGLTYRDDSIGHGYGVARHLWTIPPVFQRPSQKRWKLREPPASPTSATLSPAFAANVATMASNTSHRTASYWPIAKWRGFKRSPFRPPMKTYGSVRIRAVICRRRAATRAAENNIAITRNGGAYATEPSSSG